MDLFGKPSKTEQEKQEKILKSSLQTDEERNPCTREQRLSLKCLTDSGYSKDDCSDYFENYRNCKKFWDYIVRERRRKGLLPHLPAAGDRDKIRSQYKDYVQAKH